MRRRRPSTNQMALFDEENVLLAVYRKRCTHCEEMKTLDQFYISREGESYKYCGQCDRDRKKRPEYREFERVRKESARASRPMMELRYAANRRIREFNQEKREFDCVP